MKIDWYTKSSHLKKWQAITESLNSSVSMQWKNLGEDGHPADLVSQSWPEQEDTQVCVVTDVGSESADIVASLGRGARVRLAILGPVELNELLFARDQESIEAPRSTPSLINRLGGLLDQFDGVITVSEDQAEVIRHHLLIPAKAIRIPHLSDSNQGVQQSPLRSNKQKFADDFISFLQEVHQWLPLMRLCDRVGEELAYLGVDEEMPVIEGVSKHVSALLPGV
jgi:hypothetical protein